MPSLERRTLALADSDLAERQFWPMGVSDSGRIVYLVSQTDRPMFRVVDSTGRRLQAFGRTGDGPGEFRGPLDLQLRGDSIRIFDGQRFKLLQFTWEGRLIRESPALIFDIPLAWIADSVDHWMPSGMSARTAVPLIRRSRIGDSAGRAVIAPTDSGLLAIPASSPGGKRLVRLSYALGPDRIYLADAFQYRIYSYDLAGRPVARFGRDLPPHHRGPRELAETHEELVRASGFMRGPKGEKIALPDQRARLDTLDREVTPHFNRDPLHVDRFGRLWVIGVTNDSTTVDVFADTTFLGRTVLPCYLLRYGHPVALSAHWLLLECALPDSADRASELQLYRIVEQAPVRMKQ
jgi:hypothetical protein